MANHQEILSPVYSFRQSAPYINTHRGKTFVIAFGGRAITHANFAKLIHDIALLHSVGIRLVLVYGSRPQIDEVLHKNAIATQFHQGVRITPHHAMPHILSAVGTNRLYIESELSKGLANSPLFGAKISVISGNFVNAKPFGVRDGVDFGLTGEVRKIDKDAINHNLTQNHIVLLGSLGFSATGEIFNLETRQIASQTAITLGADKLIFLDDEMGLMDENGNLIRELNTRTAKQFANNAKVACALHACTHGVNRVHLLSYAKDGAMIEELFTTDGSGTMISQNDYDHIRGAMARDVIGIMQIIKPLEEQGILISRSRERLEESIEDFSVMERDGQIIGCVALHILDEDSAELASVAIHADYQRGERGESLLKFVEQKAKQLGKKRLFALTTRTLHWFIEHGFSETSPKSLPPERYQAWHNGRNSKVLVKML